MDIAFDPQEMVQYDWTGGHFVPIFRLMKYTSKNITKYFGHKPALELSYERETRWKMISKDSSTTYQFMMAIYDGSTTYQNVASDNL